MEMKFWVTVVSSETHSPNPHPHVPRHARTHASRARAENPLISVGPYKPALSEQDSLAVLQHDNLAM